MDHSMYSTITPEILALAELSREAGNIDPALYTKYNVNRGLRDLNGKGVLTGLTSISDVRATKTVDGNTVPDHGRLFYRGYDIKDLVTGFTSEKRFGYEEVTYLLLFNKLPDREELHNFTKLLSDYRCSLPTHFVRDIIMKAPSRDMMNTLARSVLTLYSYDNFADDTSIPNVLRQCLELISLFPLLSIYGYQAYNHYHNGDSLYVHQPRPELSTAENILHILRPDSSYTPLEASLLDIALVIHMEHGGGNNSSFTTHVVSSTMTDTYSVIAAAIGSLKGPRHGGANIKVVQMFDDMMEKVSDWTDEEEVGNHLRKLLNKKAFALYSLVEQLAPKIIAQERQMFKGVSINVDFYSGFVYKMLNLPMELYTPIFAIARIVGWSAHRLEELATNGKIMRPAYKTLCTDQKYIQMEERC